MIEIIVVDTFTDQPFAGNPAGVCLLADEADPVWMQLVARELNLPAVAFLSPVGEAWSIRWFTPAVELDICGHATLASASVLLAQADRPAGKKLLFHSRSGLLSAEQHESWIRLDFPATPAAEKGTPSMLRQALGVSCECVCQNQIDYLVEVESEDVVRQLRPQLNQIKLLPVRGVIVTARSADPTFDFVSRFFAPAIGLNEDQVSGSAHCTLGPFWADKLGKNELVGYQASSRGGVVRVTVFGERVSLEGESVPVMKTRLLI